jgi:hypothetical protein
MAKDKEKKPVKREQVKKPVATLDFYALAPAIVDGRLIVDRGVQLVLRRARKYEMITLCRLLRTQPDGTVVLQDETIGEQFLFNIHTDIAVHSRLRIYDKSKTRRISKDVPLSPEAKAALDAGLASAARGEISEWDESFSQYAEEADDESNEDASSDS